MTRLPTPSTVHEKPGGMTLVESNCVMIAGPFDDVAGEQLGALVERRRELLELALLRGTRRPP